MRLLLIALALSACAGAGVEATLRTTLNTLAQVIDPAYEAAMAACVAQEAPVMEAARAGRITPVEARLQLDAIMAPCTRVGAAFDRIRSLHEKAAVLVETGQLAEAERVLSELRRAWGALSEVNR